MMRNLQNLYKNCRLCAHSCGVNRLSGEYGYCGELSRLKIACAGLHCGEEPPMTGEKGSGTIFFSGCTLQCPYCQNYQISHEGLGSYCSEEVFVEICLRLQQVGAVNINVVTGTHFAPTLREAVLTAKREGLTVPVVLNCSGFETVETLELLEGCIDIYLPDCKSVDAVNGERIGVHPAYPDIVVKAVDYMTTRTSYVMENDTLRGGVIVRHLVIPGLLENTKRVIELFSERWKEAAILSLLTQFEPLSHERSEKWHRKHAIPFRRLSNREYEQLIALLDDADIDDGFIQEPGTDEGWLPDFTAQAMFASSQYTPVWDWINGWREAR